MRCARASLRSSEDRSERGRLREGPESEEEGEAIGKEKRRGRKREEQRLVTWHYIEGSTAGTNRKTRPHLCVDLGDTATSSVDLAKKSPNKEEEEG